MKRDHTTVEVGDYVKPRLCDGWERITHVDENGFDTDYFNGYQFEDIDELCLESEPQLAQQSETKG